MIPGFAPRCAWTSRGGTPLRLLPSPQFDTDAAPGAHWAPTTHRPAQALGTTAHNQTIALNNTSANPLRTCLRPSCSFLPLPAGAKEGVSYTGHARPRPDACEKLQRANATRYHSLRLRGRSRASTRGPRSTRSPARRETPVPTRLHSGHTNPLRIALPNRHMHCSSTAKSDTTTLRRDSPTQAACSNTPNQNACSKTSNTLPTHKPNPQSRHRPQRTPAQQARVQVGQDPADVDRNHLAPPTEETRTLRLPRFASEEPRKVPLFHSENLRNSSYTHS